MRLKLSDLKQLAEWCTPGRWKYDIGNGQVETEDHRILICNRAGNYERRQDAIDMHGADYRSHFSEIEAILLKDNNFDMEFIAQANPETILRLIKKLKELGVTEI